MSEAEEMTQEQIDVEAGAYRLSLLLVDAVYNDPLQAISHAVTAYIETITPYIELAALDLVTGNVILQLEERMMDRAQGILNILREHYPAEVVDEALNYGLKLVLVALEAQGAASRV